VQHLDAGLAQVHLELVVHDGRHLVGVGLERHLPGLVGIVRVQARHVPHDRLGLDLHRSFFSAGVMPAHGPDIRRSILAEVSRPILNTTVRRKFKVRYLSPPAGVVSSHPPS
jgi:hypothetical protein